LVLLGQLEIEDFPDLLVPRVAQVDRVRQDDLATMVYLDHRDQQVNLVDLVVMEDLELLVQKETLVDLEVRGNPATLDPLASLAAREQQDNQEQMDNLDH